jgi:hypothetical protein
VDGTRSTLREEFVVEREKTRELWGKALRQTASCRPPTTCLKVLVSAARKQRRIDRQVTRINAELNRGRVSGDGNEAAARDVQQVLRLLHEQDELRGAVHPEHDPFHPLSTRGVDQLYSTGEELRRLWRG